MARLESSRDCHRAESERFVFFSDPWINLHHFLFQWARNVPQRQPGDRSPAVQVAESRRIGELDERERSAWERALGFYRERLAGRDLVFDRDLITLRDPLASIACSGGTPDDIAADLRAALLEAMPVYRRHWWPEHLARNLEWIERLAGALAPYEKGMAARLADAYGGRWPDGHIRVDVAAYSSWHGAYTTNRPTQITLSTAPGPRGVKGVDLLFHEVSHAAFFEQPLLREVDAAFHSRGAQPPPGLVHVIQFVTPSALLRRQLRGEDARDYQPFAEAVGLYRMNPSWDRFRAVVEAHWVPFLEGRLERAQALGRIAAELGEPPSARSASRTSCARRLACWMRPWCSDKRALESWIAGGHDDVLSKNVARRTAVLPEPAFRTMGG